MTGNRVIRAVEQAVHEGHIILVRCKIAEHGRIGKRLVHDDDNVRLLCIVRRCSIELLRAGIIGCQQLLGVFCAVTGGLIDRNVLKLH